MSTETHIRALLRHWPTSGYAVTEDTPDRVTLTAFATIPPLRGISTLAVGQGKTLQGARASLWAELKRVARETADAEDARAGSLRTDAARREERAKRLREGCNPTSENSEPAES